MMSVQLGMAIFACHSVRPSTHLSVWMNRTVMEIDQQVILSTKLRDLFRPPVLFFLCSAHKTVFNPDCSPIPILFQGLFYRIFPTSDIIQIKPDSDTFLFSIFQQPLHILRFFSFNRIGIRFEFRSIPIGIQHQVFETLLGSEIDHSYPGRIRHPVCKSIPHSSVDTPVPDSQPRFHPRKIITRVGIRIQQLQQMGIGQHARCRPIQNDTPG